MTWDAWRQYPLVVRRLVIARFLRSIGQGLLVVDFSLYLKTLGWRPVTIGLILTAGGLFGAFLALGVGWFSDRWGRRRFVLAYEALTVASALIALFTTNRWWLEAIAILASFGRGQGGGAGPFGPAEQAWLGGSVESSHRGSVFSLNAGIGFLGMGLGSLVAGLPDVLTTWLPGALAYRPLFLVPALASITNIILIGRLAERKAPSSTTRPSSPEASSPEASTPSQTHRAENRSLVKLIIANIANGLAVGMVGPLMAVWFNLRFGVTPAAIGGLMAVSFVATAWASVLTGWLGHKVGMVRAIVSFRVLGVIFLAILPLMPNFFLAAVVFFFRSALNRGSVGARQAVSVSLTRESRRGWAASVNFVSMRIPASLGPVFSGFLMDLGELALPLYIAAGLQLIYAGLYQRFFGNLDRRSTAHGLHSP